MGERAERARRQLRRHDSIRETIRHYEQLCESNEREVAIWQQRLAESRRALKLAREELRDSEIVRAALLVKIEEIEAMDKIAAEARKVREQLRILGVEVPRDIDRLAGD